MIAWYIIILIPLLLNGLLLYLNIDRKKFRFSSIFLMLTFSLVIGELYGVIIGGVYLGVHGFLWWLADDFLFTREFVRFMEERKK